MVKPWRPPAPFRSLDQATIWNALMLWMGQPIGLAQGAKCVVRPTDVPDAALRGHRLRLDRQIDLLAAPLQFPFAALFGGDFDVDELEHLPPAVSRRLDQAVIDAFWQSVPDPRVGTPVIEATGPIGGLGTAADGSTLAGWHWFTVEIEGMAGGAGTGCIEIGARLEDIVRLLPGGAIAPRAVQSALAMQITGVVTRLLDSLTLSRDALASLRPGDVVVLAEAAGRAIRLAGQGLVWTLQPHDKGYAIMQAVPQARESGPREASPMTDSDIATGITFVVHFELGHLDVPLGALQAWQAGTVVTFEPPQLADGVAVTLRVNGREIGTGDLISIDDRLAVRISHLVTASAHSL